MRNSLSLLLLVAATLLLLTPAILAKPLPMSDDEIERRWSRGESEVGCSPNAPGCYVLAWVRSLAGKRATIHAADTHRDATPAWPMVGRGGEANDGEDFTYATDERTMTLHREQRQRTWKRMTPMTPGLWKQMKAFVEAFYAKKGEAMGKKEKAALAEEAPVLRPRGREGVRYSFTS